MNEVNDSPESAQELVDLLRSQEVPAKINLIPFNPYPGTPYKSQVITEFTDLKMY